MGGNNKNKRHNHNNASAKTAGKTTNTSAGGSAGSSSNSSKRIVLSQQQRAELSSLVLQLLELGYQSTSNIKEDWDQYITMQTILKRVLDLEAPLQRQNKSGEETSTDSNSTEARLAKIDSFTSWARENGMRTDCLEISTFPGYQLGLRATRDIDQDEQVLVLPRKLIFSEEQLGRNNNAQCNFGPMTNVNLAYALILEKVKPQSFWQPYIDLLPPTYSTVLYYSVEQMEALRGTSAFASALRQCRVIARQYAYLYKCAHLTPELGRVTSMGHNFKDHFCYDLYRWAVSTVMTRENLIPREQPLPSTNGSDLTTSQQTMLAALIPFWDMANHKTGEITSYYNASTHEMQCTPQAPVNVGEQFFIYYGDRSNADLLVHNGFIDRENRKDKVTIKLGLSQSDPLFEQRAVLLQELKIPRSADFEVLPAPDFISGKLLAFVRVFNMSAEQLAHWTENAERALDLLHIDCALETHHESKTWQYLQTRLMLLLRVFPTTLEADEEQLAKHRAGTVALGDMEAMLLEYRVLEKRILAAALENAKERSKA